jgi:aminodeoxychorismate synthase component I
MTEPTAFTLRTEVDLPVPFWRCAAPAAADQPVFLLDSGPEAVRRGRYSYLGRRPLALLNGKRAGPGSREMTFERTDWRTAGGQLLSAPVVSRFTGDPFVTLRNLLAECPPGGNAVPHTPFTSGLVGYIGYETAYAIEHLPDTGQDDLQLPDLMFMVVDEVLVFDHERDVAALYVTGRGPRAEADAQVRTEQWHNELASLEPSPAVAPRGAIPTLRAHFDRSLYKAVVQQCREHILAGDVFEVCLTHRLEMDLPGPAWDLYGVLRGLNPAPFASYLQLPGFTVVSASPESFLHLGADGVAESRPIKGTRPRGDTPAEDARLKTELGESEKDLAENIMIVDLVRNDLGKVCRIGSVTVPKLQEVESYATVHQLVSTVRGELKPEYDAFDLVRACFPGGSMTGAPKIEAMKIIDRLEPVKRGVYSGALGYFDAGGACDLAMVIRTIVCRDGVGTFGVGGAVVADSDPDAEYDETMDKARALIAAITQLAAGGGA